MNFIAENNSVREAVIVLYIVSAWGDCLISALNLEHSLIWRPVPSNSSDSLSLLGEILPYSEFTVNFLVLFNSYYHTHLACAVGYLPSEGRKWGFHPQDKRNSMQSITLCGLSWRSCWLSEAGTHCRPLSCWVCCAFSLSCDSSVLPATPWELSSWWLWAHWGCSGQNLLAPASGGWECHFLCYPTKGRNLHLGLVAQCSGSTDKFILFLLWRSEVRNESMGLNEVSVLGLFPVRVSWVWSVPYLFQFRWMSAFLGLWL